MEDKFVLETNIVKDLIQYHKDRKLKINNNVNIKKVYDYLDSIKFDGISKCYVTIYTVYEVLKDFTEENFNENFNILKTVLYPQIITSNYAKTFINDFNIVDLDEKPRDIQLKIIDNLKSLIADVYSNIFSDIFIAIPLSFIGIMEYSIKDKCKVYMKRIQSYIEYIHKDIKAKLKSSLIKVVGIKSQMVKYLNQFYIKIMAIVSGMINQMDIYKDLTYRNIIKVLILFIKTINSDEFNKDVNVEFNIFSSFYEWFKNAYHKNEDKSDEEIFKEYKSIIVNIIKTKVIATNHEMNDEVFYSSVENLFFRDFKEKSNKKRDPTYGFGFDINDIIDLQILMLCMKGKYFENEIPILTADINMKKLVDKYITSSAYLYKIFC